MVDNKDLSPLLSEAGQLRARGYNCAQTVAMVFAPLLGADIETTAKMTAGLGGGVGGCGEICGVASAMGVIAGMASSGKPSEKAAVYAGTKKMLNDFAAANAGCLRCADLKGRCKKSCESLIEEGIKIAHCRLFEK